MDYIDQSARGLLVGILIGILLLYVLQPKTPYPKWMLAPYDHPWIMIPLVAVIIVAAKWDLLVSLLLVLVILGIAIDVSVFGKTFIPLMDEKKASDFKSTSLASSDGNSSHTLGLKQSFGVPLSSAGIQMDMPVPHYPVFLGINSPQPGDPSPI